MLRNASRLLFARISDITSHCRFQEDPNMFVDWCLANALCLNFDKCKLIRFLRKAITYSCTLNGESLCRVESFKDLGILLDVKLSLNNHVEFMINKAKSLLGFIKRWSKEFNDPYITKRLYTSLVRHILEYGSLIWNPQYEVSSNKVESVQKQFLLFALRGLNWSSRFNLPSYENRLQLIELPSLKPLQYLYNIKPWKCIYK